ncbi:hypothetical protein HJG60_008764 [Phyllostomus discolor]|uniref:Uncharacterized protein n=1 Tax=Phyllostomus discolor TaxID=89673 RepID=A0A834DFV9_9CHIR|nr:hypothetical protein HJG60_008764 [Phyllostomus discolor]
MALGLHTTDAIALGSEGAVLRSDRSSAFHGRTSQRPPPPPRGLYRAPPSPAGGGGDRASPGVAMMLPETWVPVPDPIHFHFIRCGFWGDQVAQDRPRARSTQLELEDPPLLKQPILAYLPHTLS